jgi:hypothetical protein
MRYYHYQPEGTDRASRLPGVDINLCMFSATGKRIQRLQIGLHMSPDHR